MRTRHRLHADPTTRQGRVGLYQLFNLAAQAMDAFGHLSILLNNAAMQRTYAALEDISAEEWDRTLKTNIYSQFYLSKAAVQVMRSGSSIINTTSINSKNPSPSLLPYATTKNAIANFTAGLAQMVADRGVRVNCVAPGPIWTPLIRSTMPDEAIETFGENTPLGRAGPPAELAPAYLLRPMKPATSPVGWCRSRVDGRCCE
jgi:hypothetical protein